ncbi:MAG: protein TolR [Rhodocyclaceae bacterium]|nr:protein TolR [Rhodocyclaceae bacterium]MCP5240286.1 protein TolR [Zoogloeaceae bacterium]MCB1911951.1 protein TolR [Rhodocyclaceae bacterium]MCP5253605.1 protein TolR [Zoogloeaceae bacterium]MCP5295046.1 protein TolR [Zoogloeaceae bacterium]
MRQRRLMNQINVVPYIDVMLVLLVIFMVTAPMIQTGTVDLPSVGSASMVQTPPVEVEVAADGSLKMREPGGQQHDVSREQLVARLREIQADNPQQPMVIAGDRKAPYEMILDVMDLLQREGLQKIGLLVQPGRS